MVMRVTFFFASAARPLPFSTWHSSGPQFGGMCGCDKRLADASKNGLRHLRFSSTTWNLELFHFWICRPNPICVDWSWSQPIEGWWKEEYFLTRDAAHGQVSIQSSSPKVAAVAVRCWNWAWLLGSGWWAMVLGAPSGRMKPWNPWHIGWPFLAWGWNQKPRINSDNSHMMYDSEHETSISVPWPGPPQHCAFTFRSWTCSLCCCICQGPETWDLLSYCSCHSFYTYGGQPLVAHANICQHIRISHQSQRASPWQWP